MKSGRTGPPDETPSPPLEDITDLLAAWTRGDPGAEEQLFERIYVVLRRLAARQLRPEASTLQVTEIVHETYLRLVGEQRISWKNRGQFFAIAARVVRRVVIDHARRRAAAKRGGGVGPLRLDGAGSGAQAIDLPRPEALLALDRALEELSRSNAQAARIVEMRYFGGMTNDEVASTLDIGRTTVIRRWRFARAWLREALAEPGVGSPA